LSKTKTTGKFVFQKEKAEPRPSPLYEEQLKLTDKSKFADFAGYLMPLWFSAISDEHKAVRGNAGLFDCTHMGVFEISGPQAKDFLNTVTTNNVERISPGSTQYSYVLDAAGNVLDDVIIYQLKDEEYMVVVNAANESKIENYFDKLTAGAQIIDTERREERLEYKPQIKNLKLETNSNTRVDIALQGPASLQILSEVIKNQQSIEEIKNLKPFKLTQLSIAGSDCIISSTGYTGALTGFELFPSIDDAPEIFKLLLEKGKPLGLLPCGLGARDSLRIEAGLPLYSHELDGPHNISPIEAGYGWAVKLQKDFFIGKAAMQKIKASHDMKVVRMELPGAKGIRPVRGNDPVINSDGNCIGWVLSAAKINEKQIALCFINKEYSKEDTALGLYYLARSKAQIEKGNVQNADLGQSLKADINANVISRFEKF